MSAERVMLLIDADNVSLGVMEQALGLLLKQHGAVHVRRAYCTAESALKHQAAFKRLGIKPMVNLAAGKNSTDIALAVDAVYLVLSLRPDVVAIASSDSDFAPLVMRLREMGCQVRGMGQKGKTGVQTQAVYDDFTVLDHRMPTAAADTRRLSPEAVAVATEVDIDIDDWRSDDDEGLDADAEDKPARARPSPGAARTPAARGRATNASGATSATSKVARKTADKSGGSVSAGAARKPAARTVALAAAADASAEASKTGGRATAGARRKAVASKSDAPASREEAAPASATTSKAAAAQKSSPAARPGGAEPSAAAVLACLPELAQGKGLALNVAVKRLREAGLLGRHQSSLKLFANAALGFELSPADRPSQLRWRG